MYLQCPPHCVYHVASYAFLDHHIGLGLAMYIPSRGYSFLGGRNSSIYNLYLQYAGFPKLGIPPVIIHFRFGFSINHPAIGVPPV